ncbi:MSMEG_0565 family glycosyltransferase [Pseudonocardia sp. DSM 110487]|uniref:MSMEG_0565 family glycosyltransferase n=1 Tax=Pseudonocardia sp. DSM 110487 TaxID=2865833 RepID=UPI001C6A413A|nr:MSMEG_0565 family glycosyltransferase [Pseudonocardia sp. DSM 110487]QYN33988.1 MSMEG_0565 family glycosyltransferase [Pseudonocardia sp. DSM 110487]
MRIALLTYSTKPRGGVVHTLALAEALARAGQDVTVWSLGRGGDAAFFRPVDPAVTVRLVPFPDLPDEDVGDRILRSIAVLGVAFAGSGEGCDVVHAQDCISANAVPGCLRTVHHLDTFTTPALAACHDRAVSEPQALICVSAAVAAEVESGWGRRPAVIPNGVDAARFAAAAGPAGAAGRARWRDRLGRFVLAVGGIEPRKGTLDLVEAMALIRRTRPDLALVVAGGETLFDYRDYRARVDSRAAELGVAPIVLGPVPHADLPELVAAAEVFAFPSTKEGFGLAAMESLAAGVPLVVRDLPVLREVFDDAAAFATTPRGFAAELLAAAGGADPGRLAAGRALAARHTWDAAAAAHMDVYARTRIAGQLTPER